MKKDKATFYQGSVKISELRVGMSLVNVTTNRLSKVIGLTSNSVCMFNEIDYMYSINLFNKNKGKKKETTDWEEETTDKLVIHGISGSTWYDMEMFNRNYMMVDEIDWKLKRLEEWVDLVLIRRKVRLEFKNFV